jgi:ElaA protein
MSGSAPAAGAISVRSGRPAELSSALSYQILKLRVDVFVVEQECAYAELDGRDLEPSARWLWVIGDETADEAGAVHRPVVATLRLLTDPDGRRRIGRVATAPAARSGGIASALMWAALAEAGPSSAITLDAQSQLAGWYARFGFAVSGPEFIEDGIAHLPMDRPRLTD